MTYPILPAAVDPPEVVTEPQDPVQNEAYVAQGLGRLREFYKDKPRFCTLTSIFLEEVQAFEAAVFQVLESRWIDHAEGAQLDILGRILGVIRQGTWNDALFRVYLKLELRVLRSSGTAPEILEALRLVLSDVHIREYQPATIILSTVDPSVPLATVHETATRMKSGGVRLDSVGGSATPFRFSTDGTVQADEVHGFGYGIWAQVLT